MVCYFAFCYITRKSYVNTFSGWSHSYLVISCCDAAEIQKRTDIYQARIHIYTIRLYQSGVLNDCTIMLT